MSEDTQGAAAEKARNEQTLEIVKVYLKDASYESPLTPALFVEQQAWRPEINLQLNAESHPQGEDLYEVVLTLTVSAQLENKTGWLVEIKQAGLFRVRGLEQAALSHTLGSYCPNVLFPFAREVVADLVGKGGLPPFLLAPINFDALYAQHMQKLRDSTPAPETTQ